MNQVVLVTAIGTAAATTIISQLRRTGQYRIIGSDINPANQVVTSRDVDEFYVFPSAVTDLDGYIRFVLDFCRQHKVSYYYATIDEEVANLSRHRAELEACGVKLCIPNDELIAICHDKNRFCDWIEAHEPEIAIRRFSRLADVQEFPVFVKPVEGRASIVCVQIGSRAALAGYVREEELGKNVLVQECIQGTIITVDCVRNRATGQKIQIQRRELLRNSNGSGIAVEIIRDEKLAQICDRLMEQLDLNGVVNMEFFDTGAGYRIIEINPRFSAGSAYSCLSGVNTVLNALKIAAGEPCEFGEIAVGTHYAERYEVYCMD